MAKAEKLVSIAHVSRETGIAIDTLRAWERRYGRPTPVRLPSGHRRYTQDDVQRLRRVAELLARGRRPSELLRLSDKEIDGILDSELGEEPEARTDTAVKRLLEHTRGFRKGQLERALRRAFEKLGHEEFLCRRVAPLISAVGDEWERGTLDVRHEHFVSSILHELLRKLAEREGVSTRSGKRRPVVVLATLPGERHGLGLAMAAVLLERAGARTYFLGTDTPTEEIVAAVRDTEARAAAVSVSLATCGVESERCLEELREGLPEDVMVMAGGRGSRRLRRGVRGVQYFADSLEEFRDWLESRPFEKPAAG